MPNPGVPNKIIKKNLCPPPENLAPGVDVEGHSFCCRSGSIDPDGTPTVCRWHHLSVPSASNRVKESNLLVLLQKHDSTWSGRTLNKHCS